MFCNIRSFCLLSQCAGNKKDQRGGRRKRGLVAKIIDREKASIDCSSRRGSAWLYGYQGALVAMRDGFSGEANTNGATLTSGGHIGIGGKHPGLDQ